MTSASPNTIALAWRQRTIGAIAGLPLYPILQAFGMIQIRVHVIVAIVVLLALYIRALRQKDGRTALAWLMTVGEAVYLTFLMQDTGGARSPFVAAAYPWIFGSATTLILDGQNKTVVPRMVVLGFVTLLVGAWGTEGFALFVVANVVGMASLGAALMTLKLERRTSRGDALNPLVLNRSAGLERLEAWMRERKTIHVSFIDLGGFKGINDTHGHHVGDQVLQQVAERLRKTVRTDDAVIRFGGDEFIVATTGTQPNERIGAVFDEPMTTSVGALVIVGDIGLVQSETGESVADLLQRADAVMYENKRQRAGVASSPFRHHQSV
jgi:diguanylate cyclase (GGDEF)-like protein